MRGIIVTGWNSNTSRVISDSISTLAAMVVSSASFFCKCYLLTSLANANKPQIPTLEAYPTYGFWKSSALTFLLESFFIYCDRHCSRGVEGRKTLHVLIRIISWTAMYRKTSTRVSQHDRSIQEGIISSWNVTIVTAQVLAFEVDAEATLARPVASWQYLAEIRSDLSRSPESCWLRNVPSESWVMWPLLIISTRKCTVKIYINSPQLVNQGSQARQGSDWLTSKFFFISFVPLNCRAAVIKVAG